MPVEVPRHLYHTNVHYQGQPGSGRICEADDPEAAVLMAPAGTVYSEEDAKRLGIAEYLEAHPPPAPLTPGGSAPDAKAVEQSTVEDKAVSGPEESKSPEPPPESTDVPEQTPATSRAGRRGT